MELIQDQKLNNGYFVYQIQDRDKIRELEIMRVESNQYLLTIDSENIACLTLTAAYDEIRGIVKNPKLHFDFWDRMKKRYISD